MVRLRPRFCLAICFAFLGCAEERPTRPGDSPILSATPIGGPLTLAVSDPVLSAQLADSSHRVDLSGLDQFNDGTYNDILVSCDGRSQDFPSEMFVLNVGVDEWVPIPGAFPPAQGVCFGTCYGFSARLITQVAGPRAITEFLGADGRLAVRAYGVSANAQLVTYDPQYHFRHIQTEGRAHNANLTYHDNALYLSRAYPRAADSLLSFSLDGERRGTVASSAVGSDETTFDGNQYWGLVDSENRLICIDTMGQIVGFATVPTEDFIERVQAMTWAQGTLWFVSGPYFAPAAIYRIEIDSSLTTGTVSYDYQFSIPPTHVDAMTVDSAGFLFVRRSTIFRYSFNGLLRDTILMPVSDIAAISWDGTSLWTLHHGPLGARTDATLLSRFTLE